MANPVGNSFKDVNGYVVDGIWYPRVTSIVSIKAKPVLYRFYAELKNYAEGESIKKSSAEEGSLVHETAEAILKNEPVNIDPKIAPSIEALKKFLGQTKIQVDPQYVERQVVNYNERYAGTVDALALINGKFGVLDIKTSQAVYRDYNLQTSAYMAAFQDTLKNLQTRWILRIDQAQVCLKCGATRRTKGGREKVRAPKNGARQCLSGEHQWSDLQGVVELKEFPYWYDDYQAFLGAKKLWEWENDYWLKKIGY